VGREGRNRPLTVALLLAIVGFFLLVGWYETQK